jgi:hypothetical protein
MVRGQIEPGRALGGSESFEEIHGEKDWLAERGIHEPAVLISQLQSVRVLRARPSRSLESLQMGLERARNPSQAPSLRFTAGATAWSPGSPSTEIIGRLSM